MVRDVFVNNGDVRLHYLHAEGKSLTPVVYIPGSLGHAEHFRDEMVRLAPRPTVSLSLRGVGQSGAPERGYRFEDLSSDVVAVVGNAKLEPFCLMAYSRGVPLALRYASSFPDTLRGLILLDYPARYRKIPESWVTDAKAWVEGAALSTPPHAIERLQQESEEVSLWEVLPAIFHPTLIVRGGQEGALLKTEDAARYLVLLPNAREVVFENSGHEVYKPDYERFMNTIEAFLLELDRS
jgi:pimeloyl-ACP methyl ester carboxylesterase